MTAPVPYLSGETRHEIRNTFSGQYFFAPTPAMRHAFKFILATATQRFKVGVVAYAMMGNHIHLLVVDLSGPDEVSDVPDFRKFVRSTLAQFANAHWDRKGVVFCPESTGDSINVIDFESIMDAIVYIEMNGMEAGMERSPELLDGAVSQRKWLLEPLVVERPSFFFRRESWGDSAVLQLCVPPEAEALGFDRESFYEASREALETSMKQLLRERKKAGKRSKPLHVLERYVPEMGSGESVADHSEAKIACTDSIRSKQAFDALRAFRRQHRRAMERLRAGNREVVFPPGTYLAAKRYGVRVRSLDSSSSRAGPD